MKKRTITHDYNPVQKGLKKQKLQSINASHPTLSSGHIKQPS